MTFRRIFSHRNITDHNAYVGRAGEITYYDGVFYVHDGSTAGGQAVTGSSGGGPTSWASVTGKPTFAAVATSGSYTDLTNTPTIPVDISDLTDTTGLLGSGSGNPAYKGFRAHYGRMWDNTDDNNGPINKIVIYKDTVTPTSTIDESTSQDDFSVTGLLGSDVVAMVVVVGQNVIQTSTAELKSLAESIIDNIILDGGIEGQINSVADMKTAFYNNYSTVSSVVTDRKVDLEFFSVNNGFNLSPEFPTGKGATFYGISYNMSNDTLELGGWGQNAGNHVVGDVFVIPGNTIQDPSGNFLATPDNDVTVTVTAVTDGWIQAVTVTGSLPRPIEIWPSNYIGDGGDDEYDDANYISTNLENEISYNNGDPVNGSSAFGGGDYVVTYKEGIFGIFAVNASIDSISTGGNSGFDGDGQADTGSLYGDVVANNTMGDITFAGTSLKTANGSSPWYNGIISLMPGSLNEPNYALHGQYINIYPTWNFDQPHIHIAAGQGAESTGDLILGDDNYHVDINHNGNIYIKTNNQNNTWVFDSNGYLTLPNGGDIKDSNGNSVLSNGNSSLPRAATPTNIQNPDVSCESIRIMMNNGVITVLSSQGNNLTLVYTGRVISATGTVTIITNSGISVDAGQQHTLATLANRGDTMIIDNMYDANNGYIFRITVMVTWSSLPHGTAIIERIA